VRQAGLQSSDPDVVVAENMFGDITSNFGAAMVGGLGVSLSGDIGDVRALFQPSHGSARDIAGQGTANPIGMILSTAMMLDSTGSGISMTTRPRRSPADRSMRLSRESSRPARPARATVHVALAVTAGSLLFLLPHRVRASRVPLLSPAPGVGAGDVRCGWRFVPAGLV